MREQWLLQLPLQINHIHQLDTALKYRVVVVVREKVFDDMVTDKAAFFVEGNGEGAVTGANLQDSVGIFVFSNKIFNKLFCIAFALIFRCSGYVFYLNVAEDSLPLQEGDECHVHRIYASN